jgi:hypothetical protein
VIQLHRCCKHLRLLTRTDPTLWRSLCAYQAALDHAHDSSPGVPTILSNGDDLRGVIARWPLPEEEDIDWYREYKFRHAPLHMRWLSPETEEVKGMTALRTTNTHKQFILTPLDDGSLTIWSSAFNVARSKPGIIYDVAAPTSRKSFELGDNIVASPELDKIFVAADSTLVELSLTTLQAVTTTKFPFSISTLSSDLPKPEHPLTVGTTLTLHLHDSRAGASRMHAPLFQPSPLAILHHPNDAVYVAGRFPSILCYDRKMWPRLTGTIHSGGRLCTLAANGYDGLLAGGEYNGRGTLESYSVNPGATGGTIRQKNRQSTARGKVLAVATHGARTISCDAEGLVTWFERDCRNVVRRAEVRDDDHRAVPGLWGWVAEGPGSGPVRKVAVLDDEEDVVAVWAGDRLGVLVPGTNRNKDDDHERRMSTEGLMHRDMMLRMRQALQAQADEVRFLGALTGMA